MTTNKRYILTDRVFATDEEGARKAGYILVHRDDPRERPFTYPAVWSVPDGIASDSAEVDAVKFGFATQNCFTFPWYGVVGYVPWLPANRQP